MAARSSSAPRRSAKKSAPAKKRKKGATRKTTPVPGWIWLVTGLALGLFVTLIVHLVKIAPEAAKQREIAAAEAKVKVEKEKKAQAAAAQKSKPNYQFYDLLEKQTLEIKPDPNLTEPAYYPFMLLTGAFTSVSNADRVRAELIMQGFDAQLKTSTSEKGTTHRIVVGPFANRSRMAKARSWLIAKGVASMMINAPKLPATAKPATKP